MAGKQRGYQKLEKVSYSEWFELLVRRAWKLGWFDALGTFANEAKEIARTDFNQKSPHSFVSSRKGDYLQADWVLSFRLTWRRFYRGIFPLNSVLGSSVRMEYAIVGLGSARSLDQG